MRIIPPAKRGPWTLVRNPRIGLAEPWGLYRTRWTARLIAWYGNRYDWSAWYSVRRTVSDDVAAMR